MKLPHRFFWAVWPCCIALFGLSLVSRAEVMPPFVLGDSAPRERVRLDTGWRFMKYADPEQADELIYDVRPKDVRNSWEAIDADTQPTEAETVEADTFVLKPWILPSGNAFLNDPAEHHVRPEGNPGGDFPFVQSDFDDSGWKSVTLPHDWAIAGPFYEGGDAQVGGGMGRLPSPGVAWYRNQFFLSEQDAGKHVFLEVEGAMSYAMVWLNGHLVGGWPFGYATWQLDLTPYLKHGVPNQLAIRLDNPPESSRWYPGGGLYRDVWLVKTQPVHVAQWGHQITTPEVSETEAAVRVRTTVANQSEQTVQVWVQTQLHAVERETGQTGAAVATLDVHKLELSAEQQQTLEGMVRLKNPKLWHPLPEATPHLYEAVTEVRVNGKLVDRYATRFGVRKLEFDPEHGVLVNGKRIPLRGVNQHHDLGALGAAFNLRAAQRQLEILRDMGCNAIRMAHNPPAPALLDLCDEMGFLVFNESFDVWERKKAGLDFHLIFPDWHEQDMRALVRRDRNHPSVFIWSTGNEVGEQYTDEEGAAVAARLKQIVNEEDPTRPTSASMNWAKPHMPFPREMDLISLNYQGEGIRQDPMFEGTDRIQTPPMYPAFREAFPEKVIVSSESASAFSSRGIYLFPVAEGVSSPVRDGMGGDSSIQHVSSYELYAVDFGSAADKVFAKQDQNPYVAGEFVWSGWDYLGEPTPYYLSRSSYCGIIDLAGFPKDRYYLYQSRWRPDEPMAHILPHWNWPERVGKVTPVHVFTSGDEAELFLNGRSLGRKSKGEYEYRLRWDDVVYEPGKLEVVAYQHGKRWATSAVETTGPAETLVLEADRDVIAADGRDLSFIALKVVDAEGRFVATSTPKITFSIEGPGAIIATDNGDPTDMQPFPSHVRRAFSGRCLVIVSGKAGETGTLRVHAEAAGMPRTTVEIQTRIVSERD